MIFNPLEMHPCYTFITDCGNLVTFREDTRVHCFCIICHEDKALLFEPERKMGLYNHLVINFIHKALFTSSLLLIKVWESYIQFKPTRTFPNLSLTS